MVKTGHLLKSPIVYLVYLLVQAVGHFVHFQCYMFIKSLAKSVWLLDPWYLFLYDKIRLSIYENRLFSFFPLNTICNCVRSFIKTPVWMWVGCFFFPHINNIRSKKPSLGIFPPLNLPILGLKIFVLGQRWDFSFRELCEL